jgi:hypothetical protein
LVESYHNNKDVINGNENILQEISSRYNSWKTKSNTQNMLLDKIKSAISKNMKKIYSFNDDDILELTHANTYQPSPRFHNMCAGISKVEIYGNDQSIWSIPSEWFADFNDKIRVEHFKDKIVITRENENTTLID